MVLYHGVCGLYRHDETDKWSNVREKVVRIRVVESGHEKIRLKALFVRYGYLYFVYGLISIYLANATDLLNSSNRMLQMVSLLLYLFCLILYLLFLINVLLTLIRKNGVCFMKSQPHLYSQYIRSCENKGISR